MENVISDFGAVGDGGTLATAAIAAAVDAAHRAGGGRVVVPPGVFLTGMIRLLDGVELHLTRGAVLKASPDIADHQPLVQTRGSGDHWMHTQSGFFHLVVAQDCSDVALTGPGRLDGNGTAWYTPVDPGKDWPRPNHPEGHRMGAMVLFDGCRDILVRDVTLGNVCNWTLHLHECDRVRVRDAVIANPAQAPNSDGIDITGCRGVSISGCHIDTGDDAVCLKTLPEGRICEDVVVTGCVLRTHCAALKLGAAESFRDMRNVVFSDCVVKGSHRVLGIYSLEGGMCENVLATNITFDTRAPLMFPRPIHVDVRRKQEDSRLGGVRNLVVSGWTGETNGRCVLTCEAGGTMASLLLKDLSFRYPVFDDPAPHGAGHGGSQFSNRSPWARTERAALVVEGARDLVVENFNVRWPESAEPPPEWRTETKLANGTHHLFTPGDWTLPEGTPVPAVSARDTRGGRLDLASLEGWNGADAARFDQCDWPVS